VTETPPDWVLLEAAKRFHGGGGLNPGFDIRWAREDYHKQTGYSALCDMIAKHEQPPVDPDVEAVKRILAKWYVYDSVDIHENAALTRAVAQYKKEIARD